MDHNQIYLDINDYLDLYLIAGHLGDKIWQGEIIEALKNNEHLKSNQGKSFEIELLWQEYQQVNMQILEIYKQVQSQAFDEELQEKVLLLKQKRIELSSKIQKKQRNSKRHQLLNEVNRIWLWNVLNKPEPILLFTFNRKFIILIILRN